MEKTPKFDGSLTVRAATPADCGTIHRFILELAAFEKMTDEVVATEAGLYDTLFVQKQAEVIMGECQGEVVAVALYFNHYSTFYGRAYIYLEDLIVKAEHRHRGFGREMFRHLARLSVARGSERMDWMCLDWNRNAIDFYTGIGARPLADWTVFRLEKQALRDFAQE
ncbi:MAG: GNAT family N-acetyltransferase [Ruminococcaceae bacterium]|nr:GNAT family N-acetyltransferase [Oscillospiraceae bacterium]